MRGFMFQMHARHGMDHVSVLAACNARHGTYSASAKIDAGQSDQKLF